MVPTSTKNLHWRDAWYHMLNGKKVKRPLWEGYWECGGQRLGGSRVTIKSLRRITTSI